MKSSNQQKQFMEKESAQTTSPSIPEPVIKWSEFEKHYSRELLLMDCLDWLKDRPLDAKEILDHLEFCSSIEKTSEEFPQMDQVL